MSERETRGIQLVGVDPARESISFLGQAEVAGDRLSGEDDSRILIGGLLAEALDTAAGRRLVLVTQGADGRTREAGFRIAGVYRAEIAGLEKAFVFTGLAALQRLLGTDKITEISIRLDGEDLEASTIAALAETFKSRTVMSWRQLEPQAAAMVEVSDVTIYILFVIVMGALVFGLVNTLVTAVMERLRELGMLRAIGMRPRAVVAQVVVESTVIMAIGVAAGLVLAWSVFSFVADGIDLTAFDDSLASFGMRPTFVPVFDIRDVALIVVLSLAFERSCQLLSRATSGEDPTPGGTQTLAMTERVVECREVSRTYDDDAVPVHALRDVDFDLAAGEWVSLAGPSGSGKSTLLHVIGGLDQPTAGSVIVDGVEVTALSAAQLSDLRLNKIGFVFQAYNLIPVLSALENVEFILQLQGVDRAERHSRSRDALQSLGLADLEHRRPGEMSGGQQQRVAIARAIVTEPVLLLADEPSANLDTSTTRELLDLLQSLNRERGVTILTATHDPMVMGYTTRQVNLRDGSVV